VAGDVREDDVAPDGTGRAVAAYRERFRPGSGRSSPYVRLCLPVMVGESDDEARWWFRSVQQRYPDRLCIGCAPMRAPAEVTLKSCAALAGVVAAVPEAARR
jgi:alkanesulfonate monooxygenase SsuD/methylene tetrahydromethanopterin reductase-like flavin-dependent oxidoreductase (luciferase family)